MDKKDLPPPFLDLVRDDLVRSEALLHRRLPDQHEAIGAAVEHLVGSGGKRLRPALVFLSSHLCGAEQEPATFAAAAVEMLHTATLIHDDLIDGALTRRGIETLNASWTPGATVLTGDYVFARAAHLLSQAGNIRLMSRFAETLMIICNGEIRQMFDGRHGETTFAEYERRIYAKTASLIALAAESGPILAHSSEEQIAALRTYGEYLGLAFQVVDDILDFVADEATLGKPVGGDLRQGLVTLPLLKFLAVHPDHPAIRRVLDGDTSRAAVQEAVRVVAASPEAIGGAQAVAEEYIRRAKESLHGQCFRPPHGERYRAALLSLADFVVRRRF